MKICRSSTSRPCHHATYPRTRCAVEDVDDFIAFGHFFIHLNLCALSILLKIMILMPPLNGHRNRSFQPPMTTPGVPETSKTIFIRPCAQTRPETPETGVAVWSLHMGGCHPVPIGEGWQAPAGMPVSGVSGRVWARGCTHMVFDVSGTPGSVVGRSDGDTQ